MMSSCSAHSTFARPKRSILVVVKNYPLGKEYSLRFDIVEYTDHFFHAHTTTEDGCHGEIPSVAGVAGSHHVLELGIDFDFFCLIIFIMIIIIIIAVHCTLASNICCVSSGTVRARYCCEPRAVSGANPGMKKWRL